VRDRACGAVIVNEQILMVRQQHKGKIFWTLPGGGVEESETPADTVVREIREETGLNLQVDRLLFSEPYSVGTSYCYLMSTPTHGQSARFGYDPEDSHLPPSERALQGIAWHSIASKKDDIQVSKIAAALGMML